jgi:hypothetical protein
LYFFTSSINIVAPIAIEADTGETSSQPVLSFGKHLLQNQELFLLVRKKFSILSTLSYYRRENNQKGISLIELG